MKETRIDDGLQNYKNRIVFGLHKIEVFNINSNFNIKSHKEDDKTKRSKIETCTRALNKKLVDMVNDVGDERADD